MGAFWSAALALLLTLQVYRLAARRHSRWSYLLAVSILLTIVANWILLEPRDARYMLPLHAPLAFLAGVELFDFFDEGPRSLNEFVSQSLDVVRPRPRVEREGVEAQGRLAVPGRADRRRRPLRTARRGRDE